LAIAITAIGVGIETDRIANRGSIALGVNIPVRRSAADSVVFGLLVFVRITAAALRTKWV